jgi:1-acyl-sn-glycerol-3-phosphate acyltransferase
MWYFIGWTFFLIFFKFYLGFRVIGRENIPKKGAFIFASNHSSYFDPILLGVSCHRSLNYMARENLFKKRCFGWAMRQVHSFPVKRGANNFQALKESIKILADGKPLVIFPEGTRTKDRILKKGKRGIGFIALKSNVPVIPAYIKGSFDALPRGLDTLKRHPVRVYIGKPVSFERRHFENRGEDPYQGFADEIIRRIAELKLKAERDG